MSNHDAQLLQLMSWSYLDFHLMRDLTFHMEKNPASVTSQLYRKWCEEVGRKVTDKGGIIGGIFVAFLMWVLTGGPSYI